jgi:hypothetical protein
MNREDGDDIKWCQECGVENTLYSPRCWMCHADLRKNAPPVVKAPPASPPPRFAPTGSFFAVLTLLTTLLVVLIGFALGEMSLGYLPWFALIVIPALLATTVRVGRRRMQGKQVSWSEALLTVVISGAIVHGVLGLVAVAAVAALFIMCLISPPNFGH